MNPITIVSSLLNGMKELINDGGPSVVRFVFWAVATTITLSWVGLCVALVVGYFKFQHTDTALDTLVGGVAVTLTGFASYATNTKTVVDAQMVSEKAASADIGVVSSSIKNSGAGS